MRQIIALLIVGTLLSSVLAITPCGRCLGKGEVCSGRSGECGDNLRCFPSQSNAKLCFPVFEQGQQCTSVGEFDACETGFICNRSSTGSGNCDRSPTAPIGYLNDGCVDNTWCASGLKCDGGLCKLDTPTGKCLTSIHCPIHQYCDPTNGCVGRAMEGAACTTSPCHPLFYCDTSNNNPNPVCKAYFKNEEGSNCSSTSECKPGFICDCIKPPCIPKCIKPTYFLLGGYGAAWGQDCDPVDPSNTGCVCNYDAKIYMFLKEVSKTYPDACAETTKQFYKCLEDKGCATANLASKSCYRTNCYHFNSISRTACSSVPSSLLPPVCSAQGIAAMYALLAMMLM
jgi:hypothetical protein